MPDQPAASEAVEWAAVYNDLHWLLVLERAAKMLNLDPALTQLLADLYGRRLLHD